MAPSPNHSEAQVAEGRLDLVPMIDCIMLLLLFFILTTRFISEEKAIANVMPTTTGPAAAATVTPPQQVTISIYPAGMERAQQPSDYLQELRRLQTPSHPIIDQVWVRVGSAPVLPIDGSTLRSRDAKAVAVPLARLQSYISQQLRRFENATPRDRTSQAPVVISCFSGLPWSVALAALDSVRGYEAALRGPHVASDRESELAMAREVDLAPPRVRDASSNELGNELYEIVNQR